MRQKTKQQETAAQKLVADPYASETDWLPALNGRPSGVSFAVGPDGLPASKARSSLILIAAIVLSVGVAYLVSTVVDYGYSWGYSLIEKFSSQPNGFIQGIIAMQSLFFIVQPLTFGLSFGAFKEHFQGHTRIWRAAALALSLILSCAASALWLAESKDGLLAILLSIGICMLTTFCSTYCGLLTGEHFYRELRKRVAAPRMLWAGACALIPTAILRHSPWDPSLSLQITFYFLTITSGTALAVVLTRSRDKLAGVLIGCFALFPIFIANVLNLFANLIALALDKADLGLSLGWEAAASAAAINVVALFGLLAGAVLGHAVQTRRNSLNLLTKK